MKNTNIRKFVLVALTFAGLGMQIGCEGIYYGVFDPPIITSVDPTNTIEIANEDIEFDSYTVGNFDFKILGTEFSMGDLTQDHGKTIEKTFENVIIQNLDPSLKWSGKIILDPVKIIDAPTSENPNGKNTIVNYVFKVNLNAGSEHLGFSGMVRAQVFWSSND